MLARIVLYSLLVLAPLQVRAEVLIAKSLADNLGPVASEQIRKLPTLISLYQVNGVQRYEGSFLVADEIVFGKGAKLVFTDVNSPLIVIAANKIKLTDPSEGITVQREAPPSGETGATGAPGADGTGWGGHGSPGNTGGNGGAGLKQPVVLFFTAQFESPSGAPLNGALPLTLMLPASAGGTGGTGGHGGNGNNGDPASGDHRHFPRGCVGGRNGGSGGNGGPGGRGGDGGPGSDGVAVALIAPEKAADLFSYAVILNQGGAGGFQGSGGAGGGGGAGGDPAGSEFPCDTRHAGLPGNPPNPPNLGNGSPGTAGARGQNKLLILQAQTSPYLENKQ
jgi:hypothetical protein